MALLDTGTPLADGDTLTAESIQEKLDIIQDYLNGKNIGRGQMIHDGAVGCVTLSGPTLTLIDTTPKTLAIVFPAMLESYKAFAWSISFLGLSSALGPTQTITVTVKLTRLTVPPTPSVEIAESTITDSTDVDPFIDTGALDPEVEMAGPGALSSFIDATFEITNEAVGLEMYCPQITIWYRGQLSSMEG